MQSFSCVSMQNERLDILYGSDNQNNFIQNIIKSFHWKKNGMGNGNWMQYHTLIENCR